MDAAVVIVGAGPAGLMLAGELRLAGIAVVVLERNIVPTGQSRGLGITVRTMEVFDQRGLLPRFGPLTTGTQGHFGGIPLDFGVLGAAHRPATGVPQPVTERVLEGWARDLGAQLRRGHELLSFEQETDGVVIRVCGPEGEYSLRAGYLVGCDGGRSAVRKAGGFDFPGTDATTELLLADLRGVELEPQPIGRAGSGGLVMSAPLPGGIQRVIVAERGARPRPRSGPPAFAEVADLWKRFTGVDISDAEPVWVSAFGDATRQVSQYRRGRVLLAGDAAHVHLPAGGQGMNTGIGDSVNLGWKLAAVARGTAPNSLLDTYHTERHEVGRRLLADTRAAGQLILGGDDSGPLREVLTELVACPEVHRHLAAKASGLDIRYEVGTGEHPLLGLRMPQVYLTSGGRRTSSIELLRAGRGVLLDLEDNIHLRRRASAWTDRIDVVSGKAHDVEESGPLAGTAAVLVRPDGYVAWAAPGSRNDLPSALGRWFGAPADSR